MTARRRTRKAPPGTAPGQLAIDPAAPRPELRAMLFNPEHLEERELKSASDLGRLLAGNETVWLNVDGLGDEETLRTLGKALRLHRLTLEDIVNTEQRPKVETYDEYLFLIVRMPVDRPGFDTEQVALVLTERCVVTFQETAGDCFGEVRRRLRESRGRIRNAGPDYLAYALVDAVVDAYFEPLERLGETVEKLDDDVMGRVSAHFVERIHAVKAELRRLRKDLTPHREATAALIRDPSPLVAADTRIYLRDCQDHVVRLAETIDVYREQCSDLMNSHLSLASHRLNEVMRVLTLIATIFIPLSFIASLYGMNFDTEASPFNMPELAWPLGYPLALALMGLTGIGMLIYFWKKGWFSS